MVFACPDAKLEDMITAGRQSQSRIQEATAADLRLEPQWCDLQATWRQRRRFQDAARALIRIPASGADPMGHLFTEAYWRQLVPPDDQEEVVLTALSQATGVYFFPSREWVSAFCRFIHLLGIRRVLEAGAGRGYLAAALAPLLARQGIAFKAVDTAQGEFESGLPRHPVVEQADALTALQGFCPDLVLYAWPPPGQSIGPLCRSASVRLCPGPRRAGWRLYRRSHRLATFRISLCRLFIALRLGPLRTPISGGNHLFRRRPSSFPGNTGLEGRGGVTPPLEKQTLTF